MYKEKLLHYACTNEYVKPTAGADAAMIHSVEKSLTVRSRLNCNLFCQKQTGTVISSFQQMKFLKPILVYEL